MMASLWPSVKSCLSMPGIGVGSKDAYACPLLAASIMCADVTATGSKRQQRAQVGGEGGGDQGHVQVADQEEP